MSDRVHVGARIPEEILDLHVENVWEKWEREDVYLGIEAEMAIREYLDKDDLESVEEKLRERCTSLGCSPPKIKSLVDESGGGSKPRAMWRVHPELKEDLKAYAKETDNTYSDLFANAIHEYWTNSRAARIESLYDRLETAIEPFEDAIAEGGDMSVKEKRTAKIARELGDTTAFERSRLNEAIAHVTSDSDYNIETYTPKVAEYKGVEEHPKNENLFIQSERAAELREKFAIEESGPSVFEQSFEELTAEERVLRVQGRLFREGYARSGKSSIAHDDILEEFDNELGKTTAYNLMGRASEGAGFTIAAPHGTKKLRVDIETVEDSDVMETAEEYSGLSSRTQVSADMERITSINQ